MKELRVYLNNAAGAFPLAPGVMEAVIESMENPPRLSGRDAVGAEDKPGECRRNLGLLLDVQPEEVVLCSGATAALNIAILGMGLCPGDLVISSVMEHNSVLRPLARLEKLLSIRVEYVPLDHQGNLNTAMYEKLLRGKPRLVALTHGSNVTGRINPVKEWFEKAKDAGALTLLDAGQTVGHIPLHPAALYADMAAFSGYKGLAGPQGTGALYTASSIKLASTFTGGTGFKSDNPFQPEEMPIRLEAGTPNTAGFAGLNEAVKYYLGNEVLITAKEAEITHTLIEGLCSVKGVRILGRQLPPAKYISQTDLPVVAFVIEGMDSEKVGFALNEGFAITCRTGLQCAPLMHIALGYYPEGSVRFSPSYRTSPEDIDYAIEAVRRIVP
ncbi:aminotransferase class V-fold PLP-dependent enzyme [Treponema primitia]|uniref:aminotransferase class V-fold PLP-dependent enzyme n=1 Tax=Treponema primitia TaxID=88058 RepID=UPI0039810306